MPPKQNPFAPLPNRPKRNRKPSLQAIEAAENKAAEERWLARRRKGKAKRQAQQVQANSMNASAPALAPVPQHPLPPPPVLPAGPHPPQTRILNQEMAQLVLQQPVPPPALPSGPQLSGPQPPALARPPVLVIKSSARPRVPPAALTQTRGHAVHRSYVEALQYERDSYNNLHHYFLLEQAMNVRTPVIRWDAMKPPTNEPIVPLCHEHEPPTPQFPHPDDIEPKKRSKYVFASSTSGASGLLASGLGGGGHAGTVTFGDGPFPPPPAAKRRRRRKKPASAFSKRPTATATATATTRPPSHLKTAPASGVSPVQLPPTSSITSWCIEHTLIMAREFGRFWKKEHAEKWYEYIWWRHRKQQHPQSSTSSSLANTESPCQACIEVARLAMHAEVPSFVPPYVLKSTSIPSWKSFSADEPGDHSSQHDSLESFLEHLLSPSIPPLPISSSDSALVVEGPTSGSSDTYSPKLQSLPSPSASSPISNQASVGQAPTSSKSEPYSPKLPLSSKMSLVMPPPPTPQLKPEALSKSEPPAGENKTNTVAPRPSSPWHSLKTSASCGRETSCAKVGCSRCYYMACSCACHKEASNSFVSAGRDEPEDWVDFDTALTDVITGPAQLSTNGNSEVRAATAAGVTPLMLSMFPVELFDYGRGGQSSPNNFVIDSALDDT